MGTINNRAHTRFDFAPGMWVKTIRPEQELADYKMFQLIDISQGGLSFKVHTATELKRNDVLYILEVEKKVLKKPIRGIVKYVQAIDQNGIDFKVGIEFLEKV